MAGNPGASGQRADAGGTSPFREPAATLTAPPGPCFRDGTRLFDCVGVRRGLSSRVMRFVPHSADHRRDGRSGCSMAGRRLTRSDWSRYPSDDVHDPEGISAGRNRPDRRASCNVLSPTSSTSACPFESKVARELSEFCERYVDSRDGLWLALNEGVIEGSIAIDGIRAGQDGAHLRWFIASDRARGTGVGTALLTSAMAFCRSQRVSTRLPVDLRRSRCGEAPLREVRLRSRSPAARHAMGCRSERAALRASDLSETVDGTRTRRHWRTKTSRPSTHHARRPDAAEQFPCRSRCLDLRSNVGRRTHRSRRLAAPRPPRTRFGRLPDVQVGADNGDLSSLRRRVARHVVVARLSSVVSAVARVRSTGKRSLRTGLASPCSIFSSGSPAASPPRSSRTSC